MIHWGWAVIALFGGVLLGLFVAAMIEAGRDDDREE